MIERTGDMFKEIGRCDALVITTNGFVSPRGNAVLGRGCALEARTRWPDIQNTLGAGIMSDGNHVYMLKKVQCTSIVSFPVKPRSVVCAKNKTNVVSHVRYRYKIGDEVPGYHAIADLNIIQRSIDELMTMASLNGWRKVIMPRPGCGAGELIWSDVKPVLESLLDDRFEVYTYNVDG